MLARTVLRSLVLWSSVAGMPGCDRGGTATKTDAKSESKSGSPKGAKSGESKADGAACEVGALQAEFAAACPVSEQVLKVDVPLAPWKADPSAPPRDALPLELTRQALVVGWGEPVEPVARLRERLAEERERSRMMTGAASSEWVLSIAADVSSGRVASVLQVLADDGATDGHVLLATEDVGELPKPRKPALLEEFGARIDGMEPSMRATTVAREIERTMPPCPGMKKAFSAVAMAASDQRCALLARGLAEGLVECKCPEADDMLTYVYAINVDTSVPERLSVAVPVTLDPTASPRSGASWGEMVAGMDQAAFASLWVK